jgi:hypothetical protein
VRSSKRGSTRNAGISVMLAEALAFASQAVRLQCPQYSQRPSVMPSELT